MGASGRSPSRARSARMIRANSSQRLYPPENRLSRTLNDMPPPRPLKSTLIGNFRATFGHEPEIIARAPGRIEFIGNHTDYNGGTVLGAAIDRGVWVGLVPRAG